jgi:hypothetical protein
VVGDGVLARVDRAAERFLRNSDTAWSSIRTRQNTISALIGTMEGFQIENLRSFVSMAYCRLEMEPQIITTR